MQILITVLTVLFCVSGVVLADDFTASREAMFDDYKERLREVRYAGMEPKKPCHDEIKCFGLSFSGEKLNRLLSEGWQLQEPYRGEEKVWLKRRVCE